MQTTPRYLDGSEIYMKQLMSALQIFYKMSGLKIYEEKTKALWLGSMSKSQKKNNARKITLIKSLMLAKLTHLFLALPNPPGELIEILDKTFYKLSVEQWSGQSKKKKKLTNLRAGGLMMININAFITSLKVS